MAHSPDGALPQSASEGPGLGVQAPAAYSFQLQALWLPWNRVTHEAPFNACDKLGSQCLLQELDHGPGKHCPVSSVCIRSFQQAFLNSDVELC